MSEPILTLADTRPDERRPMTEAETGTFVRCAIMEDPSNRAHKPAALWKSLTVAGVQPPRAVSMMCGLLRREAADTLFSLPTILFVSSLCRAPGHVMLWAYFLTVEARRTGRAVTTADLALVHFPHGFPSEDGYARIWDAQKDPTAPRGNRLDTAEAWLCPRGPP